MGRPAVYGMRLEGAALAHERDRGQVPNLPLLHADRPRKQEIAAVMRMIGAPAGRRADYHWEQEATLLRTHS